jgi:hypothetical protein
LIIFAPEEAEIFKDYLLSLARVSVRLALFSYDLKTFFFLTSNLLYILTKIKSEKSTFVLKSPENKDIRFPTHSLIKQLENTYIVPFTAL